MNKLVFNFKINEKDYRETLFCMTFGIQKWKRVALVCVWIFSALALLGNATKIFKLSSVVYTCCLMVVVVVGAAFVTTLINIHKYKKVYKRGKNIQRQIVADESGMTFKNKSTEESGFNSWNDIARVQELNDHFIIGVNARDAIILPKRAILTEKDYDNFINLLVNKLDARFNEL